jgi:hypothetical protein
MAQTSGSERQGSTYHGRGVSASRLVVGGILRRAGFWGTVGLPFVALGVLLTQPPGWVSMLLAVLLLNGFAVLAGHCHNREC